MASMGSMAAIASTATVAHRLLLREAVLMMPSDVAGSRFSLRCKSLNVGSDESQ